MKKNSGFTFIELVIAVSIMAMLLVMGASRYISFRDRQELMQGAQDLVTKVREVQKMASAGQMISCTKLEKYTINNFSGNTFDTVETCSDASTSSISGSINAPVNISTPNDIEMLTIDGGFAGNVTVNLRHQRHTGCQVNVNIETGGAVSVGDPTGC